MPTASSTPTEAPRPALGASKIALLLSDNDLDGVPSSGDVLRYQIVVGNTGDADANDVTLIDTPDSATILVAGSVTTTQGSVAAGNSGTPPVVVNIGTIAPGGSVTITFDVTVAPLPPGVSVVANQAIVASAEQPTLLSDDPAVGGQNDPTVTAVTARPLLHTEKTATLASDNDFDGFPSAGDRIDYLVVIANTGNTAATGVVFSDIPGSNSSLVPGSVIATQGVVTEGNDGGDSAVGVDVGSVLAGQTITITFSVDIADPLPAGVAAIRNQGTVSSVELPVALTDDPATPKIDDPTVTVVVASPLLRATKVATLLVDIDGDGLPSPGHTLLYQIEITNVGNSAATGVTLTDFPDANTGLVPGSVAISQGVILDGDGGAPPVSVRFGTIAGGDFVTLSFEVTIDDPLPDGVRSVSNQGSVHSDQLPPVLTDDPTVTGNTDPTVTALGDVPRIETFKIATLAEDADGNGAPSPGDTLLYRITITNHGNAAGVDVSLIDILEPNTALVVGTVQTSSGTVVQGMNPGDTFVQVALDTVPARQGSATVSFLAVIGDPLPAGVVSVRNQGVVNGANFPSRLTDDPSTDARDDPTITYLTALPAVSTTKAVVLDTDNDSDGVASPGDTLLYQITIKNNGTADAVGVTLGDNLSGNTPLVVGSVQSSAGVVTAGNSPGDANVGVSVGTLPGDGGTATVSFRVTIIDPLPAGVTTVSNQAVVTGDNFTAHLSDDPRTAVPGDPTVTGVTGAAAGAVTKVATLFTDADEDGLPSPGDTILYQVDFVNTGNAATPDGAQAVDVLDPNTTLVVGSVVINQGTITSGNNPGDTEVRVSMGPIAGRGGAFTGSFFATINDPLPPGTTLISNQAHAFLGGLLVAVTDDPSTAIPNDATVTSLSGAAAGAVAKTATLLVDADANGAPSAGDTLLYQFDFTNTGSTAVSSITALDIPDPNTTLVAGSVHLSLGTITSGNDPGDTEIAAEFGTIPAGASIQGSFQVTINNPLPDGVTQVSNQAQGFTFGFPTGLSDDPTTAVPNDPTVTQVTNAPSGGATKVASLFTDADSNGVVSPGDTLVYEFDFTNTGNTPLMGITVVDEPDPNTTLVAGSVQLSLGTITSGNSPGHTEVAADIGTIPAGVRVLGSFLVTINNPLPEGVTQISNQAQGFTFGFPSGGSDDPSTPEPGDATVTLLTTVLPPTPTEMPVGTPSATPTATAIPDTPTAIPTATASATITPTSTPSGTPTLSPTSTPTSTPSGTPTLSPTSTPTFSQTPTSTSTETVTAIPTGTASATATATSTSTASPTSTESVTAIPSATATVTSTASATVNPTETPTATATEATATTETPTAIPTDTASATATAITDTPTAIPTGTASATVNPTETPTATATEETPPVDTPTSSPLGTATDTPTQLPIESQTSTSTPAATTTASALDTSTATPTPTPTATPTATGVLTTSHTPTETPALSPTSTATTTGSPTDTEVSTATATATPSTTPATLTTATPPTVTPTPSPAPTDGITATPTATPSPPPIAPTATITARATVSATPTRTTGRADRHEDDGCQVSASTPAGGLWLLALPAGLILLRRRRHRAPRYDRNSRD